MHYLISLYFEETSCTDVLAKWLVPPVKTVPMAKIKNISWKSKSINKISQCPLSPWSPKEITDVLSDIWNEGDNCTIMRILSPFSDNFKTRSINDVVPNADNKIEIVNLYLVWRMKVRVLKI